MGIYPPIPLDKKLKAKFKAFQKIETKGYGYYIGYPAKGKLTQRHFKIKKSSGERKVLQLRG